MKPMTIVISDFGLKNSGYTQIVVNLCNELVTRHDRKVTALGIGYDGSEHHWPFSIIPVPQNEMFQSIPAIIHNFQYLGSSGQWSPIEAIVVALDIPLQEKLLQINREGTPYIGIFPVESGPLCNSWSASLSLMTERLVISEFGKLMIENAGVDATYLPVGIDTESWRPPSEQERQTIRKSLGFEEDEFIVLTVADNQERKNLSIAADIISRVRKKIDAKWVLVTRVDSPVGWKLDDLAMQLDITEAFTKFDRGLPFDRLWILYAAADAFLLTSKAEGLCMPVLEAMACGTPVLATNCTAMLEHIYADPDWSRVKEGSWGKGKPQGVRGFTIPVEYASIDPWGNSVRAYADPKAGAEMLLKISRLKADKLRQITDAALDYSRTRTWQKAGEVLELMIKSGVSKTQIAEPDLTPPAGVTPAMMPRPIPAIVEEEDMLNG
jgi:glycosyltransferase involved in cell wall biosynthesis